MEEGFHQHWTNFPELSTLGVSESCLCYISFILSKLNWKKIKWEIQQDPYSYINSEGFYCPVVRILIPSGTYYVVDDISKPGTVFHVFVPEKSDKELVSDLISE